MGIDIGGPVGTEIERQHRAFYGVRAVILRREITGPPSHHHAFIQRSTVVDAVWASQSSDAGPLEGWGTDRSRSAVGMDGIEEENGGWPPHLHFQLSRVEPVGCDLPGVVNREEHAQALIDYPDPRLVLGPIY